MADINWDLGRINALINRSDAAVENSILILHGLSILSDNGIVEIEAKISKKDKENISLFSRQILNNKYNKQEGNRINDRQREVARKILAKHLNKILNVAICNQKIRG